MQALQQATIGAATAPACAAELLEAVPPVMRFIREQMRRHRGHGLSVPQFRTLVFLSRRPGASLSAVAGQLGLSLPAASRLVDGLVQSGLVRREPGAADRRRLSLSLSSPGRLRYRAARDATQHQLAAELATLTAGQRGRLCAALQTLRSLFAQKDPGAAAEQVAA
jgi:DNA-binding MarR family transcriptional regulator